MKKIAFLFAVAVASLPLFAAEEPLIRVGLTEGGHEKEHVKIFDETRDALVKHFGKKNVSFEVIHVNELIPKIKSGEVNFFISTAGLAHRMLAEGSRDLLTITSKRFPDPNHSYGSVFLVRSDSPYKSLEDLKGSIFAANRPMGFYGYVVPMGEIASKGFSPETFFSKQTFLDSGSHSVLKYLLDGKANVVTVPSCFLEDNFPKDSPVWQKLRAVNIVSEQPCIRSTRDYPNWSFSSSPGTSPALAREVTKLLLNMPTDGSENVWSIGTDAQSTNVLYRDLKTGAYEILKDWDLQSFIQEYKPWLVSGTILFIALGFYSGILNFLVRKRTNQLSHSFQKQIRLIKAYREAEERFQSLQKLGLIGQMSSMIAHELRQPLSTIHAYVQGLIRLADKGTLSSEMAGDLLRKVESQTKRVEGIVQSVRDYARDKKSSKEVQPIGPVIKNAISTFQASGRFHGKLDVSVQVNGASALINGMEIELAVLNLLRNAADSLNQAGTPKPAINVAAKEIEGNFIVTVSDNGPKIDEETVRKMTIPLKSSKAHGLGIGLSLIRTIAENHGGQLTLKALPDGGLQATLKIPKRGNEP